MQEEQLYAECGQDERTSVYQRCCVFSLLFWKTNLNNVRYCIHGNLLPVFNTDGSPLDLRRNKTTSSSKSTNPFSAARKSLLLCISQFQLRPAPPPPPPPRATAGHLLALLVPGVGHLQILGCPGAGHLPTPGPTPSFWHARSFLSEYNFTEDFTGKTSRLAHLSRTGKNWRG